MRSLTILVCFVALAIAQGAPSCSEKKSEVSWREQATLMHQGIKMAKMFKKDVLPTIKGCLDFKLPDFHMKALKICFRELFEDSEVISQFNGGPFIDINGASIVMKKMDECLLLNLNFTYTKSAIDTQSYIDVMLVNIPDSAKTNDNNTMEYLSCIRNTSAETAAMQLRAIGVCGLDTVGRYCEMKGEGIGLMHMVLAMMSTIDDESKCVNVRVPVNFLQAQIAAIEKAKKELMEGPDEIKNEKDIVKKVQKVMDRFKRVLFGILNNLPSDLRNKMYNNNTKTFKFEGAADYIKSFDGWNDIPTERDMVYNAFVECGRKNSITPEANESDKESIERILKEKLAFDQCYFMKLSKICGLKSEFSQLSFLVFNKEFTMALMSAFMETGGDTALMLRGIIKTMMKDMF